MITQVKVGEAVVPQQHEEPADVPPMAVPSTAPSEGAELTRAESLGGVLLHECEIGRESLPRGVVVMTPTFDDPSVNRAETLQHFIRSLAAQRLTYKDPIKLVIADNGMSCEQREIIKRSCAQEHISYDIVDALPHGDASKKTAAYAREQALSHILSRRDHDPMMRGFIQCGDDDAAFAQGLIATLDEVMREREPAAAFPRVVPIQNIFAAPIADAVPDTAPLRVPTVYHQGRVDINAIVAFSGAIVPKTTASMYHPDFLEKVKDQAQKAFMQWPHGSFEDMALAILLNKFGDFYYCHDAVVYDQLRPNVAGLMRQQARWGYDHVYAFHDFANLVGGPGGKVHSAVYNGISVLEPTEDRKHWQSWNIPFDECGLVGSIVRPQQIRETCNALKRYLVERPEEIECLFPNISTRNNITAGVWSLETILHIVAKCRGRMEPELRWDLPRLTPEETVTDGMKFKTGEQASVGRLVGNIVGMQSLPYNFQLENTSMPKHFLFGLRQPVSSLFEDALPSAHR